MAAIKQAREKEQAALKDEVATRKRAEAAADAEFQRLVKLQVAGRMAEVEAEVQRRLDAALATMTQEVEAKVAKERESLLAAARSKAAEMDQLLREAQAVQLDKKQRLEREQQEKLVGEQLARAEQRNAEERQMQHEQAKILNRASGGKGGKGSKKAKPGQRPKLKFGLGGASLL